MCLSLPWVSVNFKNIKVWIKIFHSSTPLEQNQDSPWEWTNMHHWMSDAVALLSIRTELLNHASESSHILCTEIAKDDLIIYSVWHQNKHLIVWNKLSKPCNSTPIQTWSYSNDTSIDEKVRVNLINLESLLLLSTLKVKSTVKEICLVIWFVQCDKWLLPSITWLLLHLTLPVLHAT